MGRVGRKKRTKVFRQWLKEANASKKHLLAFDDRPRTDSSPKKNSETDFGFYNRSASPEIDRVRLLIEECLSNYPKSELEELVSRLRSGNDASFRSAIFELFLHEALMRQGYSLKPHPELPDGNPSRPDFLVTDPEGNEFYLEAVLASENRDLDVGGEARKGVVLDTLSASPHTNFMIAISDEGSPQNPPSGMKLKSRIHQWLDSLDPDAVFELIDKHGFDSIEPFRCNLDGWSIQIRPIPLKPECRGDSKNLIGVGGIGGGWVNAWTPMRDAVKFKGGKYGKLDKPLVIAVSLNSFHLNRIDEVQALYGQEQFIDYVGNESGLIMQRALNGAWFGKSGPQYTRVSAAWFFNDFRASSVATVKNTIYLNPWANLPIPNSIKSFPHAIAEEGNMKWIDGVSFTQVFDLDDGWPKAD